MATPQLQLQKKLYTVAEYLELERQSEERHYFIDGEIFAMAGESPQHSVINLNVIFVVMGDIQNKPCQAFSPNMKIRSGKKTASSSQKGLFSYADLTVVCGEPQFHDKVGDVLVNPKVIFEVLSPSTELFDRGEKFRRFRTHNESLTDYILVSQMQPFVEHFQRHPNGQWFMTEIEGLDGELYIASIDCRLKLSEIYKRIEFPSQESDEDKSEEWDGVE